MALDDAYATSGVQDTLVAVWCGDPSGPRVSALAEQLRSIAGRNQERVFLYNVITERTALPSAAARVELQKQFAAMRGRLLAMAIVLEKTGIEGTVSRTVLSTLVTITRQPFPMRVFAVRRDAANWLGNQGSTTSCQTLLGLASQLEKTLRGQGVVSLKP